MVVLLIMVTVPTLTLGSHLMGALSEDGLEMFHEKAGLETTFHYLSIY